MIPVIIGPTGSGKTSISIEIAKAIGGEIISADSRTIYKGMDVGTAKPSLAEREGVVHYGFDLVELGERFTVKDWKELAEQKIYEIRQRGKMPLVVGGTGLYVDALVFDYQFKVRGKGYDKERGKSIKDLYTDEKSFEQKFLEDNPDREKMCSEYKVFGISWEREALRERLQKRAEQMFENEELYRETERLVQKYGAESLARLGDVYKYAWQYEQGELAKEEAINLTAIKDAQLAKRQMTWFRRNPEIMWLPLEKVYATVLKCIQDE